MECSGAEKMKDYFKNFAPRYDLFNIAKENENGGVLYHWIWHNKNYSDKICSYLEKQEKIKIETPVYSKTQMPGNMTRVEFLASKQKDNYAFFVEYFDGAGGVTLSICKASTDIVEPKPEPLTSINKRTNDDRDENTKEEVEKAPEDNKNNTTTRNTRIFISYSWDSDNHKSRVKNFVERLRSHGLEVLYDGDIRFGERITKFMEDAVRECDYVLYVCTPDYRKKADERHGGVGYENTVITGELFESNNELKFIPVLFDGNWTMSLPYWSKSKMGFDYVSICVQ